MTDKIVVLNTCGSEAEAERLARLLVEQRLAACVSIVPRIRSVYRWNGAVESSEEWLLLIKSSRPLFEPLRAALAAGAPGASLDDHRLWLSRLDTMADAIVAFAAALFALMILAMATAIGFATRGAMAGNREIIEVLHFVGAADSYIARQFQGHFLRLG